MNISTKALTCILVKEYPSSDEIRRMDQSERIASLVLFQAILQLQSKFTTNIIPSQHERSRNLTQTARKESCVSGMMADALEYTTLLQF